MGRVNAAAAAAAAKEQNGPGGAFDREIKNYRPGVFPKTL